MKELSGFIDIHTHILPKVDDGAGDIAESLAMIRQYMEAGIHEIVATPHFIPGTAWAPSKEKIQDSVQSLQQRLDMEGVHFTVQTGMEIAFHRKLVERLEAGSLLTLGTSDYFMIEPPFHGSQDGLLSTLASLLQNGIKIVLAHPERIAYLQQRIAGIEKLVALGMLIQVNSGSLLGYFGQESKDAAEQLLSRDCLHLIASDAHDADKRSPLSPAEWQKLIDRPGGDNLLAICKNTLSGVLFPENN